MTKFDMNYHTEMKAAEAGDLDAMFNVASYIIWGDLTSELEPEMVELAVRYYQANADAGDTDAMLDLGAMYLEGRGVPKSEKKALEWYQKAADLGGRNACRCIGNLYRYDVLDDGTPVPTADPERLRGALAWYQKGAERDEENCLYELGDYYRKGIIVDRDDERAFDLYWRAYEVIRDIIMPNHYSNNDSYSDVCFRLAECYHYGIGTDVDMKKAIAFIDIAKAETRKRADEGDVYGGSVLPRVEKEWVAIQRDIEG